VVRGRKIGRMQGMEEILHMPIIESPIQRCAAHFVLGFFVGTRNQKMLNNSVVTIR